MSHANYLRGYGPNIWGNGSIMLQGGLVVPDPVDFKKLDQMQASALNAVDGGTWNPTAPIIIGGAGISFGGASQIGPVRTALGGRVVVGTSASIPQLATPSSYNRSVTLSAFDLIAPNVPISLLDRSTNETPMLAPWGVLFNPNNVTPQYSIPKRFLHHAANLVGVTLNYRYTARPAANPSQPLFMTFGGNDASGAAWAGGSWGPLLANAFWTAGSVRALNSYTAPTTANATGFYYKATSVSGTHTTGGAEPTWPTTIGATVTDNPGANQIVWTCTGYAGVFTKSQMTSTTVMYGAGLPQTLQYTFDPAVVNALDAQGSHYTLSFVQVSSSLSTMLLHSVQLSFSNIASLAFE